MAWLWLAKDRVCSSCSTEIPQQENYFLKRYEGVVVLWFTTLSLCQIQLMAERQSLVQRTRQTRLEEEKEL